METLVDTLMYSEARGTTMSAGDRNASEIRAKAVTQRIRDEEMIQANTQPKLQSPSSSRFRTTLPKIAATNLGLDEGMSPDVWFDQSGLVVFDFRDELDTPSAEVATDGGE